MNRYRILVVDDNDLVCTFLVRLFEESDDIEVIGEASDGRMAIEITRQLTPDAVIMDVDMPRMDGIEASRAIHFEFPSIRVIGLSILDTWEIGEEMSKAGAVTCFSKNDPWDQIIAGIHQVLAAIPARLCPR